jgi:hypothetical protein
VVVADCDNGGGKFTQPGNVSGASLRRKRIGNQGDTSALELEARMAKPGNFHFLNKSLFSKVQAGTDVVLAQRLLYHRDRCSTRGEAAFFICSIQRVIGQIEKSA